METITVSNYEALETAWDAYVNADLDDDGMARTVLELVQTQTGFNGTAQMTAKEQNRETTLTLTPGEMEFFKSHLH